MLAGPSKAIGEPPDQPLSEVGYVQVCLDLANDSSNARNGEVAPLEHAPDANLINCYLSVMHNERVEWAEVIHEDFAKLDRACAQELRDQIRSALNTAVDSVPKARRNRRTKIDVMLDGVEVATDLCLTKDGRLAHLHRYAPKDHEAAVALLWALLLDPDRSFGPDLRVCDLQGCNRFFLATKNTAGGPRRKYCSTEHSKKADNKKAAVRQRALRKGPKGRKK